MAKKLNRTATAQTTIKDVAKAAGVSTATVSRVLTGNANVSSELHQRVQSSMEKLGYQPRRLARSLRLKVASTFGLVVSDINDPFFNSVARRVESLAYEISYSTILCNSSEDPQKENYYLEILLSERVAGVILAPCSETDYPLVETIINAGIAVTCIDRAIRSPEVDTILVDNIQGTTQAISHLIQLGHQRIAAILPSGMHTVGLERRKAYEEVLQRSHLPIYPEWFVELDGPSDENVNSVIHLLSLPVSIRPTALFIASTHMLIDTLKAIHDAGLKIPEDVAIVVFGDSPFSALTSPPLSVVQQPVKEIANLAVKCLMDQTRDPDIPRRTFRLPTEFVIRESCGSKMKMKKNGVSIIC
jgi:DNA-binding LacI/PurR family transcriptional regulator